MLIPHVFTLHEVLAVARIHPFYDARVQYPPDSLAVQAALESAAAEKPPPDMLRLPLTTKKDLYASPSRSSIA